MGSAGQPASGKLGEANTLLAHETNQVGSLSDPTWLAMDPANGQWSSCRGATPTVILTCSYGCGVIRYTKAYTSEGVIVTISLWGRLALLLAALLGLGMYIGLLPSLLIPIHLALGLLAVILLEIGWARGRR